MAKVVFQNAMVVAEATQEIKGNAGLRRKQEIQITTKGRDGVMLVGGIEVWDDCINDMQLVQGVQLAELHCNVKSDFSGGRWWWSVQAYKAVREQVNAQ